MHTLILGQSGTGKTTIARELATRLESKIPIGVLDPLRYKWPMADFVTHDREFFFTWLWIPKDTGWTLVIDECGQSVERADKRFNFLATTGRHAGYRAIFICQYWAQLTPEVRGQCSTMFIFNNVDSKAVAQKLGRPELRESSKLPPYEFFLVQQFKPTMRGKIVKQGKKLRIELKPLGASSDKRL